MGIFPHSDRLISSKGGELYRKSAQSRVEGERSFRISKNPIVEIRARFARIFPTCREDDMHSRLCAEKKRRSPLSETIHFFPLVQWDADASVVETIFNLPFPFTRRRLLVEGNSEN